MNVCVLRKLVVKAIVSIVVGTCHGESLAQQPALTEITGVLLRAGRPVPGAAVSGCSEFGQFDLASCHRTFETQTDIQGRFRFFQETGYPECTKCPCIPDAPSACDPSWFIKFQIETKKETALVMASQMGNGLVSAEFECDLEIGKVVPASRYGTKFMELYCFPKKTVEAHKSQVQQQ